MKSPTFSFYFLLSIILLTNITISFSSVRSLLPSKSGLSLGAFTPSYGAKSLSGSYIFTPKSTLTGFGFKYATLFPNSISSPLTYAEYQLSFGSKFENQKITTGIGIAFSRFDLENSFVYVLSGEMELSPKLLMNTSKGSYLQPHLIAKVDIEKLKSVLYTLEGGFTAKINTFSFTYLLVKHPLFWGHEVELKWLSKNRIESTFVAFHKAALPGISYSIDFPVENTPISLNNSISYQYGKEFTYEVSLNIPFTRKSKLSNPNKIISPPQTNDISTTQPNRVIILPFKNNDANKSYDYLRRTCMTAVAVKLGSKNIYEVVPFQEVSERFPELPFSVDQISFESVAKIKEVYKARWLILGDVLHLAGTTRFFLNLYDTERGAFVAGVTREAIGETSIFKEMEEAANEIVGAIELKK